MKIGIATHTVRERDLIKRALELEPQHKVSWIANTAEEAVSLCGHDTPDLVMMDLQIPEMGGVEATRRIMAGSPCAILIMAADVGTFASQIFEAMGQGALDAIDTPRLDTANWRVSVAAFLVKLDALSSRLQKDDIRAASAASSEASHAVAGTLIAIGASAGGPNAVRTVLRGLPKDFHAAIVVVQHMDQQFAPGMVEWLSGHSALPVRMAKEGDTPVAGTVLLASTNDHLVLKSPTRLGYTSEPVDYVYRPSVDVFFRSVAKQWGGRAVGILLTGMGRDGAAGLKLLRDKGYYTIAQDQASCAVFGMPKAAIENGAAVDVMSSEKIAAQLLRKMVN
jgi:two-component system, chemotaxis family, response regulator WspF